VYINLTLVSSLVTAALKIVRLNSTNDERTIIETVTYM
jgi:hypothetical protein